MAMTFGKFELEKQLAIGGMAEVFLARQTGPAGFSKTLCIKRILPKLATDTTFVEMFLDEARTAALLNHPNIVQIYELGEIEGSYYIAMEYIRGASLSKIIRRLRDKELQIPVHYAAKIIGDICAGLEYAHNFADADGQPLHLVHRDISPDNILVSVAGNVKMIDFGIAKAVTNTSKTQAGAVKGKFSYMSPEQVKGLTLDGRSDLFSLGIVFYELVTRRKPFGEDADLMTVSAIVHDAPRSPHEHDPDFPPELAQILERALAKDPVHRYQTAGEMQRDLEGFIRTRGDFVSSRDIGNYVQRLLSDNEEDLETLRRLGSAIRMKLTGSDSAVAEPVVKQDDIPAAVSHTPVSLRTPAHRNTKKSDPPLRMAAPAAEPLHSQTILSPEPIVLEPGGALPPHRRRLLLFIGVLIIAAAAGVAGFYLWSEYASHQEDEPSQRTGAGAIPVGGRSGDGGVQGSSHGKTTPSGSIVPDAHVGKDDDDARVIVAGTQVNSPPRVDVGTSPDVSTGGSTSSSADVGVGSDDDTLVAVEDEDTEQNGEVGSGATAMDSDSSAGIEDVRTAIADVQSGGDAGAGNVADIVASATDGVLVRPHQPELLAAVLAGQKPPLHPDEPLTAAQADSLRATQSGLLRIRTTPEMVVYIDGKRHGSAPNDFELPAGEHRVELRGGPGVSRYVRSMVISGEITRIQEALIAGLVHFDEIEAGIEIFVDGEYLGTTPLDAQPIWEGQHQIRMKRTDGQVISRTISVSPRQREHRLRVHW